MEALAWDLFGTWLPMAPLSSIPLLLFQPDQVEEESHEDDEERTENRPKNRSIVAVYKSQGGTPSNET